MGFTDSPTGNMMMVIGDLALNPHGSKSSGVGYQQGRDMTPLGFVSGMLVNPQPSIFDTNATWINATTGRPFSSIPPDLIFSIGGPGVNAVSHYYETTGNTLDRAPITFSMDATNYIWTDRNGNVVLTVPKSSCSVPPGSSDVFVIQILRDEGRGGGVGQRLVVLLYGTQYTGTWAAAWYLKNVVYREISMYGGWQDSYYLVRWSDNGDYVPGFGDTFQILAQGSPP